jgi:methyl-accepting chemotaxis protein
MSSTDIILCVFSGLVFLALLLQGLALLAISRKVRELAQRFDALSTKLTKQVDTIAVQAQDLIAAMKSTTEKVHGMQQNVAAITSVVHSRVADVDAFIGQATDAARMQIARFQEIIETTAGRIDETINILQNAVIVPILEAQAVVRGVRSAINVLFGRHKLSSDSSRHDEEMFI